MIFDYYLSGISFGKVADILSERRIPSPTGKGRWTRAAIDKSLANAKDILIVGTEIYMDVQFEKGCRCNIDYDKASNPRKATWYRSPALWSCRALSNSLFLCYTETKSGGCCMTEKELSGLYTRLALQFDSVLGTLTSKNLVFTDFVPGIRKRLLRFSQRRKEQRLWKNLCLHRNHKALHKRECR